MNKWIGINSKRACTVIVKNRRTYIDFSREDMLIQTICTLRLAYTKLKYMHFKFIFLLLLNIYFTTTTITGTELDAGDNIRQEAHITWKNTIIEHGIIHVVST